MTARARGLPAAAGDASPERRPGARRRYGPWRRATQLSVALLYLALPFANASGLRGVLGSLASTRVGPVDLVEPAAALSTLVAGGARAPWGALLLAAAPAVLLALVLGPVFCSWLCPFGLASEGIDALRARARSRRARRSAAIAPLHPVPARAGGAPPSNSREDAARARTTRVAFLLALLAASALAALPLGALLQGPRAITVAALEGAYLGGVSPFAAAVLGGLLLADVLLPRRLFCRALCPAGAVASLLRTPRTLRVAHGAAPCTCAAEPRCVTTCGWGLDPRTAGRLDGCTSCLSCVDECPSGALRPTFLPAPRREPARDRAEAPRP